MLSREPDHSAPCDIPERIAALRRRIAENLVEIQTVRMTIDQRFGEWKALRGRVAMVAQNQTVRRAGATSSETPPEMRPQLSLIHHD